LTVIGDPLSPPAGLPPARARRERRHRAFLARTVREGFIRDGGLSARHGPGWQADRRERERRLRLRTLAHARWAVWHAGWDLRRFCDELGIEPNTLRGWRQNVGKTAQPLGAKPGIATEAQKVQVLTLLLINQGDVTLRELHADFPDIPRAERQRLLWAFRQHYGDTINYGLTWWQAGTVWAMDYSHADRPIDGKLPILLAVRDLATGFVLDALPVARASAKNVRRLLRRLFCQYGPPLVIKTDNGSHFTERRVQRLLDQAGVTVLLSPAYTPRYNGAVEAGFAALKSRIFHFSCMRSDTANTTSDDLVRAIGAANAQPWRGMDNVTAQSRFAARALITAHQRVDFKLKVDQIQQAMLRDQADQPLEMHRRPATIRRHAIAAALQCRGYLAIWRRPVHQPLCGQKAT